MSEFQDIRGVWQLLPMVSPLPGIVSKDCANDWFTFEVDCVGDTHEVETAFSVLHQDGEAETHVLGTLSDGRPCTLFNCVPLGGTRRDGACTLKFIVHFVLFGCHLPDVHAKNIASGSVRITNAKRMISGRVKIKRISDFCDEVCFKPYERWTNDFLGGELGIFIGGSGAVGWNSYNVKQDFYYKIKK